MVTKRMGIGNKLSIPILPTHIILTLQVGESSGRPPSGSISGGLLMHGALPFLLAFPSSQSVGSSEDPPLRLPSPLPRVMRIMMTATTNPDPSPDFLSFETACIYRCIPQLNAGHVKMLWKGFFSSFVYFIVRVSPLFI